jgi:RNA polymerase sigma-70 factor, ECF subfamily
MKSSSDQELVKLLARGDHRAFEIIYDRCHLSVFRFAMHMSASHDIADEITQEAFLFLLRKPGAYSAEKGTLLGFLMGVARNLVRRHRRDALPDVPLQDDGVEELITESASPDSPLEHVIRRQSAEALQAALLQVPESYREVMVLCDLQEMSYAEAAAILSIPLGTVRSRLHRGHLALLDQLSRTTPAQKSGVKR